MSGEADPPLPARRYVPGAAPRHPDGAFDAIRDLAPRPTASAGADRNPAWRYGLRLFDAGFWWEAHEVLEPVWMNAPPNSAERHVAQAVIQLANAALKREMGAGNAARRLCAIARRHAREGFRGAERVMGLEPDALEDATAAVEAGDAPSLGG